MYNQEINRQAIIEYLLGSLPEAEAGRFDELSFTDDDFAESIAQAEKDLVDSYVQGELAGATLAKFESHYLASPLRREKVEFARTLQTYAERQQSAKPAVSAAAASAERTEPKEAAGFFASLNIFKNRLQWSFVAVAALVLAILAGVWLISRNSNRPEDIAKTEPANQPAEQNSKAAGSAGSGGRQLPENSNAGKNFNSGQEPAATPAEKTLPENSQKEQTKKNANVEKSPTPGREAPTPPPAQPKIMIASLFLAPSLRGGGGQVKTLSISKEVTSVDTTLELEPNDYSAYQISLTDESGSTTVWRSGALRSFGKDDNKKLKIRFPARLLKSQIYTLNVSGTGPGGKAEIIGTYSFRSVLK